MQASTCSLVRPTIEACASAARRARWTSHAASERHASSARRRELRINTGSRSFGSAISLRGSLFCMATAAAPHGAKTTSCAIADITLTRSPRRHVDTQRPGGLEIEHEFELDGLDHGQLAWLIAS